MLTVNGTEVQKVTVNNTQVNYIVKDGNLVWADPRIYLQSDGNAYINTGITADNQTGVRTVCTVPPNNSKAQLVFGSRAIMSTHSRYFINFDWTHNPALVYVGFNDYQGPSIQTLQMTEGAFYEVTLNWKNSRVSTANGRTARNLSDLTLVQQTGPVYMFTANVGSASPSIPDIYYGKIRSLDISQGNDVVRHFVPVPTGLQIGNFTVPSNGMFDILNQQFYGNQGTGEFTIERDE